LICHPEQLFARDLLSFATVLELLSCYNFSVPSIENLLQPYLSNPLSGEQVHLLQLFLELLLKWNAKINLTAIRNPDEIVRRHFGESLFAGEQLNLGGAKSLSDLGSGAGFPGLPIKIVAPELQVTLIESQGKKVAFLREVIRTLKLENATVFASRAEESKLQAEIVTLRAVEKFESALEVASTLVSNGGRLALLIGANQTEVARKSLPTVAWQQPIAIPESRERVLLVGSKLDR
jgi:16S rRNA (guanine527-N7)-methyltransferase